MTDDTTTWRDRARRLEAQTRLLQEIKEHLYHLHRIEGILAKQEPAKEPTVESLSADIQALSADIKTLSHRMSMIEHDIGYLKSGVWP